MSVTQILLIALFVLLLTPWIFVILNQLGYCRKMFCHIGWHSPSRLFIHEHHDGCSQHASCPWCGYKGMIDSQGQLF